MRCIIGVALVAVMALPSFAQDTSTFTQKESKNFLLGDRAWTISIPLWAPGFRGDFASGGISITEKDENRSNGLLALILSKLFKPSINLEFYYVFGAEYMNKRYAAMFDSFGGRIGSSIDFIYNDKEIVQASISLITSNILGGYAVLDQNSCNGKLNYRLIGLAGVRLLSVDVHSDLNQSIESLNIKNTWAEPAIGILNRLSLKRWMFNLQYDISGFGINGKLSYMTHISANYRAGKFISLRFGWNDLDLKHQGESDGEDITLKVHLSGPVIGINFHF